MTLGRENTVQTSVPVRQPASLPQQEPPRLHQATRSAADNRIRQQNGADEFPEGPCLETGAPWPGVGAATANTLSRCPCRGIFMSVHPTVHVRASGK